MNIAKWLTLWVLIALLGVTHAPSVVLDASENHIGEIPNAPYDVPRQTSSVYDGSTVSVEAYDESSTLNAGDKEKAAVGEHFHFADFAKSVAADAAAPKLFYHYTTADESLFANGLREGSSVTDKLYTNPFQASQELGIPVPNKVIPIQDVGQFIPAKPATVQPSFRFQGGGNDFNNLQRVPGSQLLLRNPLSEVIL